MLKKFKISPDLGYKSKQVNIELTEDQLFLIKHITKKIKSERHIGLRTKGVKLGVNETFGHNNKKN